MKRPILILSAGVVVIALLLLVNEKWIKEPSAPKTAAKQQESATEGQDSPSEKKSKAKPKTKPKFKPPVYDLSQKAHWYDPETTIGLYESKTLAEWLKPFKPTPKEFQLIAQYENERKKLEESISEDEYYSVEGRKQLIDEINKLNKKLREQLGEERTQFYAEVRDPDTGYYNTWEVLKVNGISEERVAEFRELADEFNQQMYGRPLYKVERRVARYVTEDSIRLNLRERKQIAQSFRDRIEKEFGKQVLGDVLLLNGRTVFMDQLDFGDKSRVISMLLDKNQEERLNSLYNVDYNLHDEDSSAKKKGEEIDRLIKREREFMEEWAKKYGSQRAVPREPPIGWIP